MATPGIRALLLHENVVFVEDGEGGIQLRRDADRLLYRLRFSKLLVGVSTVAVPLSLEQDALLKSTGSLEFLKPIVLDNDQPELALELLSKSWGVPKRSCIFFSASRDELFEMKIQEHGWNLVHLLLGDNGDSDLFKVNYVKHVGHLLHIITKLNKQAFGNSITVVGHHMKWSREREFLKRGALPMLQTESGLTFVPLSIDFTVGDEFAPVDVLLTKATDEIIGWENGSSGHFYHNIKFSEGFKKIAFYMQEHPSIFVVDPIQCVMPLVDRFATHDLLESVLHEMSTNNRRIRVPHSKKIDTMNTTYILETFDVAALGFPTIVKPQVACGASDAHVMALILQKEGYSALQVPFPAIVQEYIDHGCRLYKFYILGHRMFVSVRNSMPNAADLPSDNPAINFDSLKSLPIKENGTQQQNICPSEKGNTQLDLEAMEGLAAALRAKLGLSIFGFDIVIQEGTKDHVIVDVNYFPSFKDIPDAEAIPAFWNAIKDKYQSGTLEK